MGSIGPILELINQTAVSPSQKSVLCRTVVMGPQIAARKPARWKIGSIFQKRVSGGRIKERC
jgi:hypothetical protein